MEYVDGGSLADAVKRFPNGIQHNELVRIVTQIVDGLAYLHSQRVIHRDLKPANILFSKKGVVKIADFDISTQVCGLNTKQRSCVGTPWYTAPEVILVEPYSYSADIWSLGCTVFQLATGTCPYEGYGAVQAMFQIVHSGCPKYPAHATIREDLRDLPTNVSLETQSVGPQQFNYGSTTFCAEIGPRNSSPLHCLHHQNLTTIFILQILMMKIVKRSGVSERNRRE